MTEYQPFRELLLLLESQAQGGEPLRMADPKELHEAAEAIHEVRGLAAVQRHKELDVPLRQAEEWAKKEYDKVSERIGDRDASVIDNNPHH